MRAPALPLMTIALALMGAGLTACRRDAGGPTHVVVIGGAPVLADPSAAVPGEPSRVLLANVAQGLVRFDRQGEVVAGLAETWTVSNDGLSYIFRLGSGEWPDGTAIRAEDVARMVRRQLAAASRNPLRDALGAVDEVVAMTDRVIEIRLLAPRPGLLPLLAQPEMALVRKDEGSGPFRIIGGDESEGADEAADADSAEAGAAAVLRLERRVIDRDEEERVETVLLEARAARDAVAHFLAGKADLVMGGTMDDLPLARAAGVARGTLRFDPVGGLFGLAPARAEGPVSDVEVRELLHEAIDRPALVAAMNVDGLVGRTTLLQAGLEGMGDPIEPGWAAVARGERQEALAARARRLFGEERPTLALRIGSGPGSEIILRRLAADWGALGIKVRRAAEKEEADLMLIDAVAPSPSPAWYLRLFRCAERPLCEAEADALLEEARRAPIPAQRRALLGEAARMMEEARLFLPIAAPVRWSLASGRMTGLAANPYAVHTLVGLTDTPQGGAR